MIFRKTDFIRTSCVYAGSSTTPTEKVYWYFKLYLSDNHTYSFEYDNEKEAIQKLDELYSLLNKDSHYNKGFSDGLCAAVKSNLL